MSKLFVAVGIASALAAGSMAAGSTPSANTPATAGDRNLSCEVRATRTGNGVQLAALVHAHRPASGEYDLVITKLGAGGSSDISQGGEFAVAAGSTSVLGTAELGLEEHARFTARLTLHDAGGNTCAHEIKS